MGRPSWADGHSEYLWTGFGQCALCSGTIRIQTRQSGRVYECGTHRQRGSAIRSNDTVVRQSPFDEALRLALREVLNPDVVSQALTRAVNRLRTDQASSLDRRSVVERDLVAIRGKIDRLVDALADGSMAGDEIKARLQVETEKRRALESELASLGSVGKVASLDTAAITRDLRAKVSDVTGLLGQRTPQARAMLRSERSWSARSWFTRFDERGHEAFGSRDGSASPSSSQAKSSTPGGGSRRWVPLAERA
jgi:hypothetical protein